MSLSSPTEIVRCLKQDMGGDLEAAAAYAKRIADRNAWNPSAAPDLASNYHEAEMLLRDEIRENSQPQAA